MEWRQYIGNDSGKPDFSGNRIGEDDIIILRTYAYA